MCVSLPIVFVALVPAGVLSKINDYLTGHKEVDVNEVFNQTKHTNVTRKIYYGIL